MLKFHSKKSIRIFLFIFIVAAMLRIPLLDRFPPSLYSDEVNQGYNAYSILKTGRDEHGKRFPISFRSFGDWKPPIQTYLMIPTIALFGLNSWGVRLPSAILGTLTVGFVYFLTKELFNREDIALLSAMLLAISAWHIHHSRMAMLTVVALFFLSMGVLSFLKGLKKPLWFAVSSISFSFAIYSYYGMRLLIPLFLIFLVLFFWKKIAWKSIQTWIALAIGIILLTPLGISFFKNPDVVFGRAKTVSVFYDQGVESTLWERITQEGQSIDPRIARFFHNRPTLYTVSILRRFLSHFEGEFLFLTGDTHLPFQLPNMGVVYVIDAAFLVIGGLYFIHKRKNTHWFVIFWLFISVLPAALTFLTPAANRSFNLIIAEVILVAYGILVVLQKIPKNKQKLIKSLIACGYFLSFLYFVYQYTIVLPRDHANWWHFGYKELVSYTEKEKDNYDEVVISGKASMPYIYIAFLTRYDPALFQKNVRRDLKTDRFGFEYVVKLDKYWFPREFNWEVIQGKLAPKSLVVITPEEKIKEGLKPEKIIYYPNNTPAYKIYSIKKS